MSDVTKKTGSIGITIIDLEITSKSCEFKMKKMPFSWKPQEPLCFMHISLYRTINKKKPKRDSKRIRRLK